MYSCKLVVLVTLFFFYTSNGVCGQQNASDILDYLDILGVDALELINIFTQATSENIDKICNNIRTSLKDDLCSSQLKIICGNNTFMLRMLDAASKFPYSGMLVRTRFDFGSYDECIDLDLSQDGVRVIGKHCAGGIVIPTTSLDDIDVTNLNPDDVLQNAYFLSTCIPDGCSAKELMTLLNVSDEYQYLINDISCSTKESWRILGWDDYAALTLFSIVFVLMIFSTAYDLYLSHTNQECPNILLRAFSIYYNGKKILQISRGSSDQIKVIHGLRVISMMWIVAGHAFGIMNAFPGINISFLDNFEWSRASTYVTSAPLAVDTFFFISGLLMAYQYLKQDSKPLKTHMQRIPFLYLHRYLRLTPPNAVAFIINATLINHMGNGPVYSYVKTESDKCLNHWWSFFLYIQNYLHYDDMCIPTTWYLSADWQLFLISPIISIPVAIFVKKHFRWVIGNLLLLNIFVTLAPVGLKFIFKYFENPYETHAYLNDYFIGFMLGVFMRVKNDNIKYRFNYTANLIIWIIILSTMILTVLAYKEIQLAVHFHNSSYTTYYIILRAFWSIGLSWIVYSCHNGHGGFINRLLTTPFVEIMSKLTYCIYLSHILPVVYLKCISRVPVVYSVVTGLQDSIVVYFTTVIIAVIMTLAFESPLITLEKYLFGRKR